MSPDDRRSRRSRAQSRTKPAEGPSGWRSSRRASRSGKKARRTIRFTEVRERISATSARVQRGARTGVWLIGWISAGIVGFLVVLLIAALAINGVARWNARRSVDKANSPEARLAKARDNLLLIGMDENGNAVGFLALKVDGEQKSVYGIAIPDGAFMEVPGQGFERIGDSWGAGPDVALDAVSNFFSVPFEWYGTVDNEIYQTAMKTQSMKGVMEQVKDTNLSDADQKRFLEALDAVPTENVALVPMPVKPINLGEQTYFEPQRAEIADLVKTWWGVDIGAEETVTRVIVYNGAGIPGIAGEAAQQLIRAGYRVVDTKNADRFDYATTQVVVQNGSVDAADDIVKTLGVGKVTEQAADQQVADIIVIIGKDYKPPAK